MDPSKQDALVRGIDHAGVTVPSIEEASRFFAALGAEMMYDLIVPGTGANEGFGILNGVEPMAGEGQRAQLSAAALGLPPGVRLLWMRMLRLGGGATIELFQYVYEGQREPARAFDLGLQHLAVYVDDIDVASDLIAAAGAELFEGPNDCPGLEAGPGGRWRYARLPWGGLIELITYPGPMPYEAVTPLRRTWARDTVGDPPGNTAILRPSGAAFVSSTSRSPDLASASPSTREPAAFAQIDAKVARAGRSQPLESIGVSRRDA